MVLFCQMGSRNLLFVTNRECTCVLSPVEPLPRSAATISFSRTTRKFRTRRSSRCTCSNTPAAITRLEAARERCIIRYKLLRLHEGSESSTSFAALYAPSETVGHTGCPKLPPGQGILTGWNFRDLISAT